MNTEPIIKECNNTFLEVMEDPNVVEHHSNKQHPLDEKPEMKQPIDDEIFYKNPIVLFGGRNWRSFWPNPKKMATNQMLNTVMRFAIYLSLILILLQGTVKSVIFPITVGVGIFLAKLGYDMVKKRTHHQIHGHATKETLPTPDNPFMNTLLTEVGTGKPKQPATKSDENECVNKLTEYHFNKNLFKEVGDLYNKNNSQNRFYTMPNTNEYGVAMGDTVKFANWLYNPPKPTCKEDTRYCNRLNDLNTRFPSHGKVGKL